MDPSLTLSDLRVSQERFDPVRLSSQNVVANRGLGGTDGLPIAGSVLVHCTFEAAL